MKPERSLYGASGPRSRVQRRSAFANLTGRSDAPAGTPGHAPFSDLACGAGFLQGLIWASRPPLISMVGRIAFAAPDGLREYTNNVKTLPSRCMVVSTGRRQGPAYLCDGSDTHPATLARWLRGGIAADGMMRVTIGGVTLVAQLQGSRKSFPISPIQRRIAL